MEYLIEGGNPLRGELRVYGAKNCALALLGATVLTDETITLTNCPNITDIDNMLMLLGVMGKKITRSGDEVSVSGSLTRTYAPEKIATLLRGSALILGSTVARYGQVVLPLPGGCAIGARPMDIHLCGLRKLGISVLDAGDLISCSGYPVGAEYSMRMASVGATENLLCACVLAKGESTLINCAMEPEVVALEEMLVQMGAQINGIGTSVVRINGVAKLHGTTFKIIPDRIVAATYLAAAAATRGNLTVNECNTGHLQRFIEVLQPHFDLKKNENSVHLEPKCKSFGYGTIETAPYPGFPTDMQSLLLALAACSDGETVIKENLFENRLEHNANELNKMGADIKVCGNTAIISGRDLIGAEIVAKDLRGGAGLVIAALAAHGTSRLEGVEHISRGYMALSENLNRVGANIENRLV